MESRMNEFRDFVKRFPGVRDEVINNKNTWQKIYEDWVILGENDARWDAYRAKETIKEAPKLDDFLKNTNLKNVIEQVKKINPDSISKTLNTVQKVLQITQSFGGKPAAGLYNANYNSWWD